MQQLGGISKVILLCKRSQVKTSSRCKLQAQRETSDRLEMDRHAREEPQKSMAKLGGGGDEYAHYLDLTVSQVCATIVRILQFQIVQFVCQV